jgi:hypothetical protein
MGSRETEPFTPYEPEPAYDWDYGEEPASKGPNVVWGRVAILGVGLLLAFFVGRASAPDGIPEERVQRLNDQLTRAEDENETLQAQVEALQEIQPEASPEPSATLPAVDDEGDAAADENFEGKTYVVQSGDNLRNIAQRFCGDPLEADYIAEFNGLADASLISPGTELNIPEDCGA